MPLSCEQSSHGLTLSDEPKNKVRRLKKLFLFERSEFKSFSRQPVAFSCEAGTVLTFFAYFLVLRQESKMTQ